MNFKTIFEKYKDGTATGEERKIIEDELEKNELINEYLSEQILSGSLQGAEPDNENYQSEAARVKKNVQRKLLKVIAISVALALVLTLSINYVVLPLYDKAFYNPNEGYTDQWGSAQFFVDVSAFTELHFPGYITNSAKAESLGMGKYNIYISQYDFFGNKQEQYQDMIIRGKAQNAQYSFYRFPVANGFYERAGASYQYRQEQEEKEQVFNELRDIPLTSWVNAYISFKEDMPLTFFNDIKKENEGLNFAWVAIRAEAGYGYMGMVGIEPTGSGIVLEPDTVPEDDFPDFELANSRSDENHDISAETLETHFKTLLKYLSGRGEFLAAMSNVNGISTEYYKQILDYVNENGVKTYGVVVRGSAADILNFAGKEFVNSIMIDNVKTSVYSKQ